MERLQITKVQLIPCPQHRQGGRRVTTLDRESRREWRGYGARQDVRDRRPRLRYFTFPRAASRMAVARFSALIPNHRQKPCHSGCIPDNAGHRRPLSARRSDGNRDRLRAAGGISLPMPSGQRSRKSRIEVYRCVATYHGLLANLTTRRCIQDGLKANAWCHYSCWIGVKRILDGTGEPAITAERRACPCAACRN